MSLDDETLNGAMAPEALLGSRIEDYDVESIVGAGAMGVVYQGSHSVIGKRVAIKVLKLTYADDPAMKARVIREARTVNAIRHPSIVDAFGFGTLPTGQPYIVMDLLEGEPLDAFIDREAPMNIKDAFPILDELLSGLAAAHQVGVIHRDIKPGNIFLESSQGGLRVKLLDFGLAGLSDKANGSIKPTNPGSVVGTPAFMAPEQILAQKMTPVTDLYAVGGIAYLMFTARLPFQSPNAWDMLNMKLTTDVPSMKPMNSMVHDELDKWVLSMLARDPSKRPASAEEARKQLKRALESRVSGNFAALGSRGVVPSRTWQDARTEVADVTEGSETQPPGMPKSVGETTENNEDNPFAKTRMREGLPSVEVNPAPAPAVTPTGPGRRDSLGARQFEVPASSFKGSQGGLVPILVVVLVLLAAAAFVYFKLL